VRRQIGLFEPAFEYVRRVGAQVSFLLESSAKCLLAQEFKRIGCRLGRHSINRFPERWIVNLPRCLPVEKFPTSASGRQGRGPVALSGFHPQFPRARLRDVA
jgi:hypothetical protein